MADSKDDARSIADSISITWPDLIDDLRGIFGEIGNESGQDLLTTLGFDPGDPLFDKVAESTLENGAARAAELVGKRILADGSVVDNPDAEYAITDSTREMLYATINDALESGMSAGALRNEIVDTYAFSARRALNIARTERSFAQNGGALTAAKASGVVKGKYWPREGDLPCDICDENEAAGVIPLDDDFPSGDPSPPGHPGCVDSIAFTTEDVSSEQGTGEENDDAE